MKKKEINIDEARNAKRESRYIDFKESFNPESAQDWCETVKDIVAIANAGGGILLFGQRNDGSPSGWDPTPLITLDPAKITDKLAKYTNVQYADFEIKEILKDEIRLAAIVIKGTEIPMVFVQPGTYDIGGGKQKTAFSQGTIYFRHGAKSEPCNSNDIREIIKHAIENHRKEWMGNIRKVIYAPKGHTLRILPPDIVESSSEAATAIRITDDPEAPAYRKLLPDKTHPYRRKDVIEQINFKISGKYLVNGYAIDCIRKIYNIDKNPDFFYKSIFSAPQYSSSFIEWLFKQFQQDPQFFEKAKVKCKMKK
jgi:hypothetical protein